MATNANQLAKSGKFGDLRRRLTFLLLALVVYRLGAHIPVPGIDPVALQQLFRGQQGYWCGCRWCSCACCHSRTAICSCSSSCTSPACRWAPRCSPAGSLVSPPTSRPGSTRCRRCARAELGFGSPSSRLPSLRPSRTTLLERNNRRPAAHSGRPAWHSPRCTCSSPCSPRAATTCRSRTSASRRRDLRARGSRSPSAWPPPPRALRSKALHRAGTCTPVAARRRPRRLGRRRLDPRLRRRRPPHPQRRKRLRIRRPPLHRPTSRPHPRPRPGLRFRRRRSRSCSSPVGR